MQIDALLFDVGGVLVELGDFPVKKSWLRDDVAAVTDLATWLKAPTAQAFEKGQSNPQEFARQFIADANLDVSSADFLAHFTAWPRAPFAGVHEVLDQLKGRHVLSLFSNTNELHWDRLMLEMDLGRRFDYRFSSHLMGLAKPDIEAFLHVATEMEIAPGNILFFDDSPVNVEAALSAGLQAEHTVGFDAVLEALDKHNIKVEL